MPFLLALCVIFMPFIVLTFNSHQMHCIAMPISVRHIVSFLVLDRVLHFRPIPIHRFFAVNRIRYRCDTDFLIRFKSGLRD